MAQKIINLGTPNGKNGSFVRDAFSMVQDNFTELYDFTGNTINSISISGTTTKTITLTKLDGSLIHSNFIDISNGSGGSGGSSIDSGAFNTSNGILTLSSSEGDITFSLDGRYPLTNHTHTISDISDFPINISSFTNDSGYLTEDTNVYVTGVTVNGSVTKTLTINQSDGSAIQTTFTDLLGSGDGGSGETMTGSTFNTSTGDLEFSFSSGTTIVTSMDGRYSLNNHTHTASDITDFDTEVSNNTSVALNTAKISYTDGALVSTINTNLTNHINDSTKHFTQAEISITEAQISDLGNYSLSSHTHTASDITDFDTEVSNNVSVALNTAKISYTDGGLVSTINTNLTNHINDSTKHFTQAEISITESQISDLGNYSLSSHTHTASDITDFDASVTGNTVVNSTRILAESSVQPNVSVVFQKVVSNAKTNLTYVGNTINWVGDESNLYSIILTADSTLQNPTNPIDNTVYQFIIEQDATGLWSLAYGNMFKFQNGEIPIIDVNPNSKGILTAIYDGTDLLVASIQNFL